MKSDMGGIQITEWLKDVVLSYYSSYIDSKNIYLIDDIKKETGYVALNYQAEHEKARDVLYKLPDSTSITISDERFKCTEGLFDPKSINLDCVGVDQLLIDSINACEDQQKDLYSNIVINGGSTLFDGFDERLTKELEKKMLSVDKINVIRPKEGITATWVGQSVFTTLNVADITVGEYNETGKSIVNIKC